MNQPHSLFVYGSLLFDPVIRAVAGMELNGPPATLDGYSRRTVGGARYPAIISHPGAHVTGRVLLDVPSVATARLDAYEDVGGGLYEKRLVDVSLEDGTWLTAWAYIAGAGLAARLAGDWDPATFDITAYLASADGPFQTWRRREEGPS